jgi:hypothetical protein
MNEKVIDFTIGADPEFACVHKRRIVNACDYVEDDSSVDFGCDGNNITFELRPAPSKNPIQIVNNIRDIFVRQVIKQPEFLKFKWVAGSWHKGYPFGGHVHFGLTNNQIRHSDAVEFLDHYVGACCLLIEKQSDARNRRCDDYGHMGDMREQYWGFEYRPMSSWLSTPYVAAAMLCLSKTVMYEVMNNSKFKWHKFVVADDFPKCNQARLIQHFPAIWDDITKMHLYQTYKPYIDLIYYLVKNKLTWLNTNDMKDCWGIINMAPCIGEKVGVDVLWNRYNLELNNPQQ